MSDTTHRFFTWLLISAIAHAAVLGGVLTGAERAGQRAQAAATSILVVRLETPSPASAATPGQADAVTLPPPTLGAVVPTELIATVVEPRLVSTPASPAGPRPVVAAEAQVQRLVAAPPLPAGRQSYTALRETPLSTLSVPSHAEGGQAASETRSVASTGRAGDVGGAGKQEPVAQPAASRDSGDVLIGLLHRAISRNKQYPMLARRQRREGTATVAFDLYPDGVVEALSLTRSSGFSRLDDAALRAVKGVEPFSPARQYMSRAERFQVNVVFSLN